MLLLILVSLFFRQLLGEDLSELTIEHLETLENQLEMGTKAIRTRKVKFQRILF